MKGHIKKRYKDSWSVIIDAEPDETGKRKQNWHTVRGTKRDAERELARLLHERHTGEYVAPTRQTVATYLRQWLADYAKAKVAPKTFERYAEIVGRHLVPALGQIPLEKLRPLHIQRYYTQALTSGRLDGKAGGLSARTVLHHHRLLHEALKTAIKWRLLVRNPVEQVEPPRPEEREMQALDEEQTARLLSVAKKTPYYLPILIAVTTGLRRGEILGLRWKDLDLALGTLTVRQTLEATRAGLRFKEPKTKRSRRTIVLLPITRDALEAHRQTQEHLRTLPSYQDHDLVLARPDGRPLDPMSLTHAMEPLLRRAGLPRIRFHDLRHSHVSQLLKQGNDLLLVSRRLGHSQVSTTANIYAHLIPGVEEGAMRKLQETMLAAAASIESPKVPRTSQDVR